MIKRKIDVTYVYFYAIILSKVNIMREEIAKLTKEAVLKVSNWGMLGFSGYVITNKKELYFYQYYEHMPKGYTEEELNFVIKKKDLTSEEFTAVTDFIKTEVFGKEFEDKMIFDAGFDVFVCLDGISKNIKNDKGFDDKEGLYDKAEALVKSLIDEE